MRHVRDMIVAGRAASALLLALMLLAAILSPRLAAQEQVAAQVGIFASQTAEPFARALAKTLAQGENGATPKVRIMPATRAVKAFCRSKAGQPALLLLARPLRDAERKACTGSRGGLTELPLGREQLVLAQGGDALDMRPSLQDLYLALAARVPVNGRLVPNPYQRWDEINPDLPMREIRVVLPTGGGVREALVREVLHRVCRHGLHPYWDALKAQLMDEAAFRQQVHEQCSVLRDDGAVQAAASGSDAASRLTGDATALGLLGRLILRKHGLRALGLRGMGGSRAGGLSRPLHLYARGLPQDSLARLLADDISGKRGVLAQQGLAPLPAEQRARLRQRLRQGATSGEGVR